MMEENRGRDYEGIKHFSARKLVCHNCGKNLLENVNLSMVLIVRNEKDQVLQ